MQQLLLNNTRDVSWCISWHVAYMVSKIAAWVQVEKKPIHSTTVTCIHLLYSLIDSLFNILQLLCSLILTVTRFQCGILIMALRELVRLSRLKRSQRRLVMVAAWQWIPSAPGVPCRCYGNGPKAMCLSDRRVRTRMVWPSNCSNSLDIKQKTFWSILFSSFHNFQIFSFWTGPSAKAQGSLGRSQRPQNRDIFLKLP